MKVRKIEPIEKIRFKKPTVTGVTICDNCPHWCVCLISRKGCIYEKYEKMGEKKRGKFFYEILKKATKKNGI